MESNNYGCRSVSAGSRNGVAVASRRRWTCEAGFANLPKESNVRESDGRGGHGREPEAGFASGDAKQRGGGNRPDDDQGTGESSSGKLGKDSGEAAGGNLCSKPCKEGRDTQTERRHTNAGHPN